MAALSGPGSVLKPEVKSEVKTEVKTEIKDEPGVSLSVDTRTYIRIKDEDDNNDAILKTIPNHDENDMFDDVDGEEVVDLTYEGIAHINDVRHFVCEGFKIRQIPEPFIVKRPLTSLFENIVNNSIVLDPDYQREVVWDEGRASLLITSILMGYFIPPIIFNVKETTIKVDGRDQQKYTRICVDGKQRLTSIWKFMTGQIGFFDSNIPQRKWYFCQPRVNGREEPTSHLILPKAVKKFFESQFFCCYEYQELDIDTEETMFQLVQRGIALTPGEKMRAMSTEWANFTKQYEDNYSLIVNLTRQSRASGFRLVLTIFTMVQEVLSRKKSRKITASPTLQASPQALMKVLSDETSLPPSLKLKLKAIFDRYEGLVKRSSTQITATRFKINKNSVFDPAPDYLRDASVNHVRTFSPLELIVTAVLVSMHMDHRTDDELLSDIKEMRRYLRVRHKDLRVNAQCWATSWEFLSEEMTRRRNQVLLPSIEGFEAVSPHGSESSSPLSELSNSPSDQTSSEPLVRRPRKLKLLLPKKPAVVASDKVARLKKAARKRVITSDDESKDGEDVVARPNKGSAKRKLKLAPKKAKKKAKKKA